MNQINVINIKGLSIIAFLTYMIMSGLLTQIGVIIGPLSSHLSSSIPETAALFSYLTGGTFAGTFISMLVYRRYTISFNFRWAYLLLLAVLLLFLGVQVTNPVLFCVLLFTLGISCGVGLAGGAVIISSIYHHEQKRAAAFLATDCSFSLAGYIFPTFAAMLGAAGYMWSVGYGLVGLLAIAVLGATLLIRFPDKADDSVDNISPSPSILTPRVLIIALALCLYLISQTSFLTWAPQYLQTRFLLSAEQAAGAVGNYWGPSIFGLLCATYLITIIPIRPFLLVISVIAVLLTLALYFADSADWFLTLTLGFGFLTSCMFKVGISVGSQQLPNASPALITFLLCSATLGSTLAPMLSAKIVELTNVQSAILIAVLGYSAVTLLFSICLALEKYQVKPVAITN